MDVLRRQLAASVREAQASFAFFADGSIVIDDVLSGLLGSGSALVLSGFMGISQAQIVPDATLPQASIVLDHETGVDITGGTIAGANIFHSFEQFGLHDGDRATFVTPSGIDRILTRVTGGAIAEIDGILSANADLIFLAPNGIHFGDQASLDLRGSFIASTASAIEFEDGLTWSSLAADATQTAASSPILSMNVPVGLQFDAAIEPGTISASGGEQVITIPSISATLFNVEFLSEDSLRTAMNSGRASSVLETAADHTLALIGGEIDIQRTQINTSSGAIVLGGVHSGRVALTDSAVFPGVGFDFSDVELGGQIQLRDRAAIVSSGSPNGAITLNAGSIAVQESAVVVLNSFGTQPGGDLSLMATDTITIDGNPKNNESLASFIRVSNLGDGVSGDIAVAANRLDITQGSSLGTIAYADGTSGNVDLNIREQFSLLGFRPGRSGATSNISSATLGTGRGGSVIVQAPDIALENGGGIFTLTIGTGRSGDVHIEASEQVHLAGVEQGNQGSSIGTATLGSGLAGNVEINTPRLSLIDGGRVGSLSIASGHAGDVVFNSTESIILRGQDPILGGSSIFSSAESFSTSTLLPQSLFGLVPNIETLVPTGDAGNLTITTPIMQVQDQGKIQVANLGLGNPGRFSLTGDTLRLVSGGAIAAETVVGSGGVIDLNLRRLELDNGAISTATVSTGRGSDIRIRASEQILVSAQSLQETQAQSFEIFFSNSAIQGFDIGIISGSVGEGAAGNIEIETGELIVRNGGLISPAALRAGDAGSLTIQVTGDMIVDSGVLSTATISQASDAGRGGDIVIEADNLTLSNGGSISTTTLGRNDAGQLRVNVRDRLLIEGNDNLAQFSVSALSTGAINLGLGSVGNGGEMSILARRLVLNDGAGISASSGGLGNAGSIDIEVDQLALTGEAFLLASSNSGEGGNLTIRASSSASLQSGSQLSTQAGSALTGGGNGGNLRLETDVFAAIGASQIAANAFSGSGGQITIDAQGFFLGDRSTIDASSQLGIDGIVEINRDTLVTDPNVVSLSSELLTQNLFEQGCAASRSNRFTVVNHGRNLGQAGQTPSVTAGWHDDRDWRDLTLSRPDRPSQVNEESDNEEPDTEHPLTEASQWHYTPNQEIQLVAGSALPPGSVSPSACDALMSELSAFPLLAVSPMSL